jgi:hypothetical protein
MANTFEVNLNSVLNSKTSVVSKGRSLFSAMSHTKADNIHSMQLLQQEALALLSRFKPSA